MAERKRVFRFLLWGGLGLLILVLGAGGVYYFLYRSDVDSESRFQAVKDFIARVKPGAEKPPIGPPRREEEAAEGEERTHIVKEGENLWAIARKGKLVENAWQWKQIVTQNKEKIDFAFVSEETGEWKVLVEPGQELKVRQVKEAPSGPPGPVKKKFALQLLSVPLTQRAYAVEVVKKLLAEGHYAYLYRADVNGNSSYRIRAGFYESEAEAHEAEAGIRARIGEKKLLPEKFWVVVPSDRELRGEMFEYGVQRSRPWVIELPHRESHSAALKDLRKVFPTSDFAYIAQAKDSLSGLFVYSTRIGFFSDQDEAESFIRNRGDAQDGLWRKAKVMTVKSFGESLPGQTVQLRSAKR